MFKELYMKHYKSSKKLTKEQVEELESKKTQLIEENKKLKEDLIKINL